MTSSAPIVLAFFRDEAGGNRALLDLRQHGFRRSVVLQRSPKGAVRVRGNRVAGPRRVLLGSMVAAGSLVGIAVLWQLTASEGVARWLISALILLGGLAAGWWLIRRLNSGVTPSTVRTYREWVLSGESMVLIQVSADRAGSALDVLRRDDDQPTVFVLHPPYIGERPPANQLRRERFAADQIKRHAAELAAKQRVRRGSRLRHPLWHRMRTIDRTIDAISSQIARDAERDQSISLAAEWLLDNAYIIHRHIADIQSNLTRSLYNALPVLSGNAAVDEPRVYAMASEFVSLTDAQVYEQDIVDFLDAYQAVSPLTIAELWAMPLMIRMALLENLRFRAIEIDQRQYEHERADLWSSRLLSAARRDPDSLLTALSELVREQINPSPYLVDRLITQLEGEPLALGPLQVWLEHKFGAPIPDMVRQEQREQAIDQVTLANAIGSLRQLSDLDWRGVFERVSPVDRVLDKDPAGIYAAMDFATRDRYRKAVEEIARRADATELEVAATAVEAAGADAKAAHGHVGYFLLDIGRVELEAKTHYRPPFRQRLRRWFLRHPTPLYLGGIGALTIVIVTGLFTLAGQTTEADAGLATLIVLAVLALFPASDLAIQLVGRLVTTVLPPRPLPKMWFADGIPDEWRTLVVVPDLWATVAAVHHAFELLEIRFLANQDTNLHFALLADLPDAPRQEMPTDEAIITAAIECTGSLNERYPGSPFSLFYRGRRWSESEQVWMGWERKRGKLEELNRLLIDQSDIDNDGQSLALDQKAVLRHVGDSAKLNGVRFIITLDADTELPRGTARRMVESLAHPLNRPQLAPDGRTVSRGYTIIQPRVTTSLASATATRFSMIYTDPVGSDPYSLAVSDVYQDMSGEGSYHGKGIYDLQVFHHVLSGRFPESSLLSHDLLEGAYVRVGLATDIELFDLFPESFPAYNSRQSRWIRGDWQIAAWCTPRVPEAEGWVPNPLSVLNRWKVVDNLRRSLVAPTSVALFVIGWLFYPSAASVFCALIALTLILAPAMQLITYIATQPLTAIAIWRGSYGWREMGPAWLRAVLGFALLPHQAAVAIDAIARVAFRRLVSRRRLLEWHTSQMAHKSARQRGRGLVWRLATISLLVVALLVALVYWQRTALWWALPVMVVWIVSPAIVAWLNARPTRPPARSLTGMDRVMLRRLARQTWRYFDDFVGPQSNWLPPDNYQDALRVEVAQRTSPTNIGLWLLSGLTANDCGYLTPDDLFERSLATLDTLHRLEKFEGHILNWYDTATREPLRPRYVSAVDSGNLLASLWAAAQGYGDVMSRPLVGPQALEGVADTLGLVREALKDEYGSGAEEGRIAQLIATVEWHVAQPATELSDVIAALRALSAPVHNLAEAVDGDGAELHQEPRQLELPLPIVAPSTAAAGQCTYWCHQLARQVDSWLELIDRYLPWIESLISLPDEAVLGLGEDAVLLRRQVLLRAPSLRELAAGDFGPLTTMIEAAREAHGVAPAIHTWLANVAEDRSRVRVDAAALLGDGERLIAQCNGLADGMNLRFLYDPERRLFTIGYNVETLRLDSSYYDLLASEARIASFVAIARGDAPQEHWAAMGRMFRMTRGRRVLLSWSGTMFEYLMPLLLMRNFTNSLLDDACREAVSTQIDFGARNGVPWGVSESAFSELDANRIYQYKAFGVPGLGVRRGLRDDLVVAPYATALALLVDPHAAVQNLKRLTDLGLRGNYGYFDAIDFTRRRQPDHRRGVIAHTYMAHHQGMILVAIGNALHENRMQARFHADLRVRATEAVLHERIPVAPTLLDATASDAASRPFIPATGAARVTRVSAPDGDVPYTQLLGSSAYSVMVTSAGGGYSRWRDIDISRWRLDSTLDAWGNWCYVRDLDGGAVWSTAYLPTRRVAARYSASFTTDRVEFERRDVDIETVTEIAVSVDDDVELRRITLVNHGKRPRHLDLTTYTELALASHGADLAHPAFNKLFVHTELMPDQRAVLASRRPRSPQESPVWAAHLLTLPSGPVSTGPTLQVETDRARFVGRGRTMDNPVALDGSLSNTTGWVLDPIFSLRCDVTLAQGERVQLVFVTGAADTREGILAIVEKYQDANVANHAFDVARSQALLEPRQLRISLNDVPLFQQLASHMLFPNQRLRAAERQLRQNSLGQSRLWGHGISGDIPIALVMIGDQRDLSLVREVVAAHTYWRLRGFVTDLVILNDEAAGYTQPLGDELKRMVQTYAHHTPIDQRGGIFLRSSDRIPGDELALIMAAARIVLVAARGTLAQQLAGPAELPKLPPLIATTRRPQEEPSAPLPFLELPYFNGLGGFSLDGKEYSIYLGPNSVTPAPWVNVFANPAFGALVSESGGGFCWAGNSQSNRLLPWSNDPVIDPPGDALYIRDEDSGIFWTPTAAPVREIDAYRARHGQGYTLFEHNSHAIEQELLTFVPVDNAGGSPVRLQRLRLRNRSARRRRLSIMAYNDWVLGNNRDETQMHIVTNWDVETGAIFARNRFHPEAGDRVAFAGASPRAASYTGDRREVLGRNGTLANPAALLRQSLSNRTGAGLDPCAAFQVLVEIEPGQEAEVIFCLGQATDAVEARSLLTRFQATDQVEAALEATRDWWDRLLGTIQVETPDLAVNLMLNRWLLYQTLSCRVWGRSGFYQSGGAVGFRDQLQDAMALVYAAPHLSRAQILMAAGRQFVDGDVQHWWHPQTGAGVRTRISDDLLWLPYVTAHYVRVTGDDQILNEDVSFLDGPPLEEHEHERYFVPTISAERGSLSEHCHRAITHGLTSGRHGLPLIGTGDWNDGMNQVGAEGRGESVWMAWFLIEVLRDFAEVSATRGDEHVAGRYAAEAERLAEAIETHAWDGSWYRRAYFDDGSPLGSSENKEARIDSLAQSWAVLSGAGDPDRASLALRSVKEHLVRERDRLILLLTPPFEQSGPDPGYIAAYPPGVRENGGQYTHAALWVAQAFARCGDGDSAAELLRMLNPIEHARTPEDVARYAVEPYVVAADVYALAGHVGRGGWTWYTGSSGWMYRVWLEDVLGFKLRGSQLTIDPMLPNDWQGFSLRFHYRSAHYAITVVRTESELDGINRVDIDGTPIPGKTISLLDDGGDHTVRVQIGRT